MSFRRSVFADVGGFRSDIGRVGNRPTGCEETEFCLRAARRWQDGLIVYEPLARVVHTVTAARGSWSYFLDRCYAEGLSKAVVGRLAGSSDGLRSERRYALRTVPRGVLTNLGAAVHDRDLGAFSRAVRMIAGLSATTAGYCVGRLRPNA
jgi:hypothetical protein